MTHYRRFDGDAPDGDPDAAAGSFAAEPRAEQVVYNQPLSVAFRVILSTYGLILFAVCAVVVVQVLQAEQRQVASETRILKLFDARTAARDISDAALQKQIDEQNLRTTAAVCAFLEAAVPQSPAVIDLGSAFGCPGYPIPAVPITPAP